MSLKKNKNMQKTVNFSLSRIKFCTILTLILSFQLMAFLGISQNLNMVNGTFDRCSGTLYDPGGTANYPDNANVITTIRPSTPGSMLRISFTTFKTVPADGDELRVYDGLTTADPLLTTIEGTQGTLMIQANNPDGALTFEFVSSVIDNDIGFEAIMSCVFPCQSVVAELNSSTPIENGGFLDICTGQTLEVNGKGEFIDPQVYAQSDANSTFQWGWGDDSYNGGQSSSHVYSSPGVYDLNLNIIDINDCESANDLGMRVRVSDKPTFIGTTKAQTDICIGETNTLTGLSQEKKIEYYCVSSMPDTTFVPDGIGIAYSTSITLDCFDPGTQVTSASDVVSVCIDLEHSYIHDLNITITCPNGTTSDLYIPYSFGNFVYTVQLGEPVDNDNSLTLGDPYTYCFTMGAADYMEDVAYPIDPPPLGFVPNHDYTDNDGEDVTDEYYVPGGDYLPEESFASLVGCPLNGDWTISITDRIQYDNGAIFNWSVDFDPALYSIDKDYTPVLTDKQWVSDPTIVSTTGNEIVVQPTVAGPACYVFSATDEFGCDYDTTICFNVSNTDDASFAYDQTAYCADAANPILNLTGVSGGVFSVIPNTGLDINTSTGAIDLSNSIPNDYTITYTTPVGGCISKEDRMISIHEVPSATMSGDANMCEGDVTIVSIALTGAAPWDMTYSDGTTNSTITGILTSPYEISTASSGNYSLISVSNDNCTGTVFGSATVVVNDEVLSENFEATCAPDNSTYTVTFNLIDGNSATYAVTGMNGGTISNPNPGEYLFTSNPIDVATTDYSFDITDVNGCPTTPVTGTRNCLSSNSAEISGGGNICSGETIDLNVEFVGTAPFDFEYSDGSSNYSVLDVPSPYVLTVSSAGNYTLVSMEDADGNGLGASLSGSANVTVQTRPTLSVNNPSICEGNSVDLTATPSIASGTYNWTTGSEITQTITVSPTSDESFEVVYSYNDCVTTASGTVTVKQIPEVTVNDATICEGSTATLTAVPDMTGGTYSWSPGSFGDVSEISVTPTTVGNEEYTVIYTVAGCASTAKVSTVTVNEQPTMTVNDEVICSGDQAVLTANASPTGGTYTWASPAPAGSNNASITVEPTTNTEYPVSYELSGCIVTLNAEVTVNETPVVTVDDVAICQGESADLFAQVDISGGNYSWGPGTFQNKQTITVYPSTETTYTLRYTLGTSCYDATTATVTVTESPTVEVNDETICEGESAVLTATPSQAGGTYLWDYNNSTDPNITVSPTSQTFYNVVYKLNGCETNGAGTVDVNSVPQAVIDAIAPICEGSTLNLSVSPNGASYAWIGPGDYSSQEQNPSIENVTGINGGEYTVEVTLNSCSSEETVIVEINSIEAILSSDVIEGCVPLTVDFMNSTTNSANCNWTFGDGQSSNKCAGLTHVFEKSGRYDVTLNVVDENGCKDILFLKDYIYVEELPTASFQANPEKISISNPTCIIINNTVGATSYVWTYQDESSTEEEPEMTFKIVEEQEVEIKLVATSALGCVDSTTRVVKLIEDLIVYVPNAFTPDANNLNQTFLPVMTQGFQAESYVLSIYDRWGGLLFRSNDTTVGWDGSVTINGDVKMAPSGSYIYIIDLKLVDSAAKKKIKGHVTLLK
jgi:gliding motility-associated-like protein